MRSPVVYIVYSFGRFDDNTPTPQIDRYIVVAPESNVRGMGTEYVVSGPESFFVFSYILSESLYPSIYIHITHNLFSCCHAQHVECVDRCGGVQLSEAGEEVWSCVTCQPALQQVINRY